MKYLIFGSSSSGSSWADRHYSCQDAKAVHGMSTHSIPMINVHTWGTSRADVVAISTNEGKWACVRDNGSTISRSHMNIRVRPVRMWVKKVVETTGLPLAVVYDSKTHRVTSASMMLSRYVEGPGKESTCETHKVEFPAGISGNSDLPKVPGDFLCRLNSQLAEAHEKFMQAVMPTAVSPGADQDNGTPVFIAANQDMVRQQQEKE